MANSKITLRKEQIQLLEKLMVTLEKTGLPPALAKVMGLLLVNDEPELTFEEIKDTLEISKSAASTAINQLLSANKIIYRSKLGDRKRYFSSRIISWQDVIKSDIEGLSGFGNLLQMVLDQRPAKTKEFNKNLKNLIEFMNFVSSQLPILLKKFEAAQK